MASLKLNNLCKVFKTDRKAEVTALAGINLEVPDGELMALVGPSGCGKSTLLRLIAGLDHPSNGSISLGNKEVNNIKPQDRDVAMVFQNYALFPHLTVEQNIIFSLKFRKISKSEMQSRVDDAADLLGITDFLQRKPAELSGGQRQRVALGRAMVCKPKIFLLDEPLSNLDARMRAEMRAEIAKLHNRLRTTMIFVTHDQTEAMTLGQRICVINKGKVMQVGAPLDLYQRPVHKFVGDFIGTPGMNFIKGRLDVLDGSNVFIEDTKDGDGASLHLPEIFSKAVAKYNGIKVLLGIRSEHLKLIEKGIGFKVTLDTVETLGHESLLHIRTAANKMIVRSSGNDQSNFNGKILEINWSNVIWFDYNSGLALI
tara:strand:- start:23930 stop:25039 length:1110 start_codon:yes stop_codon:yes gene_type:complete